MDWDDARVFLAVARSGQILGASKRLGLNHATVARRMTALEDSLKTKLLIRRTTGCDLTDAGEEFMISAERMEAEALAMRTALGDQDTAITGSVRIGAPDGFGVGFLAPVLPQLSILHPDLTVQLVPVPRSFSLSRREVDIAITVEPPDRGRLVARKLIDYTLRLYASRSYLDGKPAPQSADQLGDHRLVGYVDDLIVSASLDYAAEIWRDWKPTVQISSAIGQLEAVRAGAGIGILHAFMAQNYPDLVPVLPERIVRRTYWLSYHESVRSLRRIRAVSDFISHAVGQNAARFS